MSYDSRPDTWAHIHTVQERLGLIIDRLRERAHVHDQSKLVEPEVGVFDEYTPKLKHSTYGSDEYKGFLDGMGVGLRHHYAANSHHPEHYGTAGIHGMDLLDLIEMLADWKAATERHDDGDLARSIEVNRQRFGYGPEIETLLIATADRLGWLPPAPSSPTQGGTDAG